MITVPIEMPQYGFRKKMGIVPNRTHSYRHTALSEILNRIDKHYFPSDVRFPNICHMVTGQSGAETYGVQTGRGQWYFRVPTIWL